MSMDKPFLGSGKIYWGKLSGIDAEIVLTTHALQRARERYLYTPVILDIMWNLDNLLDCPASMLLRGQSFWIFEPDTMSNIVFHAILKGNTLDIRVITIHGGNNFIPFEGTVKLEMSL